MVNFRSNLAAEQIREIITMQDVLREYGFQTSRNGRIPCPLHNGHDPNFSYKDHYFKCFVCGESGSVIDFVMKLFGISFPQALIRISSDFGLDITPRRATRQEANALAERRRKEEEERRRMREQYERVAEEHRYWLWAAKLFAPETYIRESDGQEIGGTPYFHPLYCKAVKRLPQLEYWLDENIESGLRKG